MPLLNFFEDQGSHSMCRLHTACGAELQLQQLVAVIEYIVATEMSALSFNDNVNTVTTTN